MKSPSSSLTVLALAVSLTPAAFAMGDFTLGSVASQVDGIRAETVALKKKKPHRISAPEPEPVLTELDLKKITELGRFLANAKTMPELQVARGRVPVLQEFDLDTTWNTQHGHCVPPPPNYTGMCWDYYMVNDPHFEVFVGNDELKKKTHFTVLKLAHTSILVYNPEIPTDAGDGSQLQGSPAEMTMYMVRKAIEKAIEFKATDEVNDARSRL